LVIFEKRVPELSELALTRFVGRARQAAGLKGAVDILVTSSGRMRSLNRRFRDLDKTTDVLSFPAVADDAREEFAGEIAISAEIAAESARALGHRAAEEVKILVLHGLLHLRGYDHERDDGEMARRERQLRTRLGLPSGLIERNEMDGIGESGGGRRGKPRLYEKSVEKATAVKTAEGQVRRKKTR
jgi:probable rRNA maturation factor